MSRSNVESCALSPSTDERLLPVKHNDASYDSQSAQAWHVLESDIEVDLQRCLESREVFASRRRQTARCVEAGAESSLDPYSSNSGQLVTSQPARRVESGAESSLDPYSSSNS